MILINPGSRIPDSGDGWTNTVEGARRQAEEWLANMRSEGLTDVELLDEATPFENRWRFTFRHTVTGVEVTLETHGIDDLDAYQREQTFSPRTYWNGSSSATPQLADFAAEGFEPVQTFRTTATAPTR